MRRRVDDARADVVERTRAAPARSAREFLANTNNTLGIQFWVAQVLADKWGITREEMDAFALQSHQRAAANTDNGFFAGEIVPVPIKDEDGELTGEVLRPTKASAAATTIEKLASLPPAWVSDDQPAPDITAGNSSQMTDGAAAMLIADRPTSPSGSACRSGRASRTSRSPPKIRCSCCRRRCPSRTS